MSTKDLMNDLKPIAVNTRADLVEVQLREYLDKKGLKAGDVLPTEMDLSEALGVSRNVLREGLSRLRMLGLIESKKKRGMVLTSPDILGSFERVLNPQLMDTSTLKNLFELRLVLESGLADLLFLRKTDADIKELEAIIKKEKSGDNDVFRVNSEIAFHGKLYEITGNDTLKRFQIMLMPVFDYVLKNENRSIKSNVSHTDLVRILKEGTKEDFVLAMREHLRPHYENLSK
ncbi:DNA-binding transcriptional regulator, FadR family [Sphingobacterium nematocida]|uniref:DNA-binding transcriptional regulator, FadR family n=1 Tax=Sphingobacterium nematocida TaxID=1513896 RepID=A0A1T5GER2_9SPHI|nr:FCD domain-containing protein [Sphingobacterium nematocida]SKC06908.1 DNA-binding transcriptional regulator, FadR family [Sphingobacterium nematocida]